MLEIDQPPSVVLGGRLFKGAAKVTKLNIAMYVSGGMNTG
jgi:hypothetical protein